MNIHEYQAKAVLREFGVPVPRGIAAFTTQDAEKAANELGGPVWVVKAQIHAGGRGKAGGVKVVRSVAEVKREAERMLGSVLVTHQTGPHAHQIASGAQQTAPCAWQTVGGTRQSGRVRGPSVPGTWQRDSVRRCASRGNGRKRMPARLATCHG